MLFDIEHVTNVFYVDKWITVTQDGGADWTELVRKVAEPIRAAPTAATSMWSVWMATSSACTTRARAAPVQARYPARSEASRIC